MPPYRTIPSNEEPKADYVVALKANHPTLYTQVKNWFEQAQAHQFDGIQFS